MELEVNVRWSKFKKVEQSEEDKESKYLQKLFNGEETHEKETEISVEYQYGKMTVELEDVVRYGEADDNHTILWFRDTESIIIKTKYSHFKALYEFLKGKLIRSIDDMLVDEKALEKMEAKVKSLLGDTEK